MFLYLLVFITSILVTVLLVPLAKSSAFLFNAIDKPSARKVHAGPMPRCGGIALVGGFLCAVLLGLLLAFVFGRFHINYFAVLGVIAGAVLIFFIGLVDDIKGISPSKKLLLQIFAASVPVVMGVSIQFISIPFTGVLLLGVFSVPLTLLWIVGATNALNFIDGLDGLASGVSAIAAATLFVVALKMHQPGAAMILAAVAGAAIGFLRFNFHPASIFLGDSGSLFLGYILASASIIGVLKSTIIFALLIPVFILGVPIFDTASVIMRRMRDGHPIFYADRRHLHHRLLDRGFSHKQVVISIYFACILLSIATLSLTFLSPLAAALVLAVTFAMSVALIRSVKRYVKKFVVTER
jgi:UDP-GlcNAc:undecaprenyl-phosphate/decaprenyl-phosphate GlcNAc-1-phosphate transferase